MLPFYNNLPNQPRKENMPKRIVTKHNASKKNFKHVKNFSRGELNHLKFINGGK